MEGIGKGLVGLIVTLCIISIGIFWGGMKIVDWLFIDDAIISKQPIKPTIKIVTENGISDTTYIYRR